MAGVFAVCGDTTEEEGEAVGRADGIYSDVEPGAFFEVCGCFVSSGGSGAGGG